MRGDKKKKFKDETVEGLVESVTQQGGTYGTEAVVSIKTNYGEYRQLKISNALYVGDLRAQLKVAVEISAVGSSTTKGGLLFVSSITIRQRAYGESRADRLAAQRRYFKQFGLVACFDPETKSYFQHPVADTVEHDGKRYRKIDYLLEILGGAEVTRRMREAGFGLVFNKELSAKYRAWLDEQIEATRSLPSVLTPELVDEIPF